MIAQQGALSLTNIVMFSFDSALLTLHHWQLSKALATLMMVVLCYVTWYVLLGHSWHLQMQPYLYIGSVGGPTLCGSAHARHGSLHASVA